MKLFYLTATLVLVISTITQTQVIHIPENQPTIQAGIDAATTGDTVLVDQGTYFENINFNGKSITVMSNYLNSLDSADMYNTIIDGSQPVNPDQASVVYFTSGEDTTSMLCGFTIKNGNGTYPDAWGDRSGGGVFCENSCAKIIHNRFIDNHITNTTSSACGAGVYADSNGDDLVILKDNFFAKNELHTFEYPNATFGGGVYIGMDHIVQNNVIKNNYIEGWAYGAGVVIYNCPGIFSSNLIENNKADVTVPTGMGGGIFIYNPWPGYKITLNRIINNICEGAENKGGGIGVINWGDNDDYYINKNFIIGNVAGHGAGINLSVSIPGCIIENNIISNNKADDFGSAVGAGIYIYNSDGNNSKKYFNKRGLNPTNCVVQRKEDLLPQIINNTITNNLAVTIGGGIANGLDGTNLLVFNNIIYGNNAVQGEAVVTILTSSTTLLHYNNVDTNLIYGNWSGSSNTLIDPQFNYDGYHLHATSLCIDAGIDSLEIESEFYYCPNYDIDDEARPFDIGVDIGADEYYPLTIISERTIANKDQFLSNFPNPFTENTTITFELQSDCYTDLTICNLIGQKFNLLINVYYKKGIHEFQLDATLLDKGIYLCILKTNIGIQTRKMLKL